MDNGIQISIRFTAEQIMFLDSQSEKDERSIAWHVRQAVNDYIAKSNKRK